MQESGANMANKAIKGCEGGHIHRHRHRHRVDREEHLEDFCHRRPADRIMRRRWGISLYDDNVVPYLFLMKDW